jgi:sugar O-acyltransferase (sialic acid O-acetyltransferase NeuD family)
MKEALRRPLLIFPCNGNGIEALDCAAATHEVIGFIDDTPSKQGTKVFGIEVFGRDALWRWPDAEVLAVPGGPSSFRTRRQTIESLEVAESRFATVVHPRATTSPLAQIGRNVLLMAGVVVTSNATIGNHVCILPNSVVHHDARIGDLTLVGSGVSIAGSVVIGENCYIATGSTIMHGIHIGDRSLIGLGSNVIRNVEADLRVAGNPARPI